MAFSRIQEHLSAPLRVTFRSGHEGPLPLFQAHAMFSGTHTHWSDVLIQPIATPLASSNAWSRLAESTGTALKEERE